MTANFKTRRTSGAALAEFGPALFLLFICLFFPLLDLAMMGVQYFACTSLNDLQARKAAVLTTSQCMDSGGIIQSGLPQAWQATGIGTFVQLNSKPNTEVSYADVLPDSPDKYVIVSTTFTVRPFLTIPFFPGVPGLGAPVTYTIVGKRILEDPKNYGK